MSRKAIYIYYFLFPEARYAVDHQVLRYNVAFLKMQELIRGEKTPWKYSLTGFDFVAKYFILRDDNVLYLNIFIMPELPPFSPPSDIISRDITQTFTVQIIERRRPIHHFTISSATSSHLRFSPLLEIYFSPWILASHVPPRTVCLVTQNEISSSPEHRSLLTIRARIFS